MSEFEDSIKRLLSLISERIKYLQKIASRYPSLSSYKKAEHVYKAATERDLQVAIEAFHRGDFELFIKEITKNVFHKNNQ
ncbi:MAG: hypothetical protein N2257_08835 [Thermodesulfovibrionales bacterium]|nr:hypothetical protein [Thermodesulfovibrionales bacterium]